MVCLNLQVRRLPQIALKFKPKDTSDCHEPCAPYKPDTFNPETHVGQQCTVDGYFEDGGESLAKGTLVWLGHHHKQKDNSGAYKLRAGVVFKTAIGRCV